MLGFEVTEDTREFESEKTTRYSTANMQFPCFVVIATDEKPVRTYTIEVLKKMFVRTDQFVEDLQTVNIYFSSKGKTVGFGKLQSMQVKAFLSLFENNDVDAYLDKDTKLEGDMRYILA